MMKQGKNPIPPYFPAITGNQATPDETLPSLQKGGKPPREGPIARTRRKTFQALRQSKADETFC
jgi:hypothetical protein